MFRFFSLTLFLLISASFAQAESVQNSSVTNAYFTSELWSGEGIPRFKAKINISALLKPSTESTPVEGLVIKKGSIFEFIKTNFQTLEPTALQIEQEQQLIVINYGQRKFLSRDDYYSNRKPTKLTLKKGEIINVLQYRAEGEFFFEYQNNVYGGGCPPCQEATVKTAWWVQIEKGTKSGWVLIEESTVEFLERQF